MKSQNVTTQNDSAAWSAIAKNFTTFSVSDYYPQWAVNLLCRRDNFVTLDDKLPNDSEYFLIGRKRTVNFRNPRLWRHNCRLFKNHVKVTGNHVVYDRGAWFLRVIMSSSLPLFSCPQWRSTNEFFFCFIQCIIKQLLDSVFVISRITVHRDNTTHYPNVCFHSFSRKHFVATKLFCIVFAGAIRISSRAVRVFPALSPRRARPSYGNFFVMVFQGNCARGRTVHMMNSFF